MRTALRFKMHGEHSLGRRLFSTYFCRRCSPFFGSKHAHRAGETVTHHASTRPTTMCPASRTLAVTATLAVLANLLKGCAETEDDGVVASPCARDKIVSCNAEKSALTTSVCGATEYSKVFAGETTVAACCQALKEAQACYLDGCGCETPCAAEDQAEACPSSGKLSDPINFWAYIMDGLNKTGETCQAAGVSPARCED
ncbi:unnamed protein product [Durusdinium trenchii]|uniref:Uncharacterized protein n=2 Tax=Durusdinium trenchii TaxID=1381693 RepID=A0ABP0Q878_9DINO